MSSRSVSPEQAGGAGVQQPDSIAIPVSCHLAYEVQVTGSTTSQMKKKTKTMTKKQSKVKQFTYSFAPTKDNYIELLNTMIIKHTTLKVKNKASDE